MGSGWSQEEELQQREEQPKAKLERNESKGDVISKPTEQLIKLPHRYQEILKDADTALDKSSPHKLLHQLHHGVFLNQKKKKYWVNRNSKNCFMLFASELSITWGQDTNYWRWISINESSDEAVTAAELLNVCWLEVHARLDTANLTPNTMYEVLFVVMFKDPAYGWEVPVNLRLTLPDKTRKERKATMNERPRGQWIEIYVGEFKTSHENAGDLEMSLYEYQGGDWKRGLIIKGVIVRSKE